jgi:transcriptional regulator with XRE-family HTH domain
MSAMPCGDSRKETKDYGGLKMPAKRSVREQCEENLLALAQSYISSAMRDAKIYNAELARRMKCSRSWITRMMNGDSLITVGTLARALKACGYEVAKMEIRRVR